MLVGKICNREVVFVEPETSIAETAQLMREHHVGGLVVVQEKSGKRVPVGIITDLDLVLEAIRQVHDDGYAISDEELELGLRVLAVPIRCNGETIAALSVSASSGRVDIVEFRERFLPNLKSCADRIARGVADMN